MNSDNSPAAAGRSPQALLHTLVILRHAQAHFDSCGSDRERSLTTAGEQAALARGRQLSQQLPCIDRLLVSPAVRTRQTAALALPDGPDPVFIDDIYEATAGELLRVLENHGWGCTVLVGHNPGLSDLATVLSGQGQSLCPGDLLILSLDAHPDQPLQPGAGKVGQRFGLGSD